MTEEASHVAARAVTKAADKDPSVLGYVHWTFPDQTVEDQYPSYMMAMRLGEPRITTATATHTQPDMADRACSHCESLPVKHEPSPRPPINALAMMMGKFQGTTTAAHHQQASSFYRQQGELVQRVQHPGATVQQGCFVSGQPFSLPSLHYQSKSQRQRLDYQKHEVSRIHQFLTLFRNAWHDDALVGWR